MSRNAEIIVSRQGKLLGKAVRIDSTSPAKIKAVPGARYVLKEADSDVSPENVTVRRVGDDLQVMLEGEDAPALTLEGYYALSEPSGLYGIAEDAGLYAYVPTDASTGFLALPDGQMTPLALGGEPLGPAESLIPTQSESTGLWGMPPWLLLAGAGAAIAGTVVAATSGGSGSKTPAPAPVNPQALDQVGPVQGVLTNGDVSDDTRPVITGTGIAGYTITVYDGEQVIGTTVVGADGIWRFQPEAPLGDGEHHLAVTQAGPDAPQSVPVPVVDVAIDSVPPATPAATIAGTVDGLTTNDTRPTINGTGEPGDRITVTFPGGESKTTTVAADGTWSVKADTALPDGPQDIVVSEQDPAGNTTTMTMPAVVDTEAPPTPLIDGMTDDVAPVTGPVPNGGQTNDTTPTLAGVAEPGSTIKVYDNEELIGTVTADGQGAWSFTPAQPLAEGDHAIEVTATDRAGNTSEAASYAVTVDTSAPPKPAGPLGLDQVLDDVGPIQGPIAANGVTDDRRPTFTGFGTAGETVTVYDNGQAIGRAPVAANGQWSLTPSADLAEGQHRITTTQTDLAGNESAQSDAFVFSLDITPPDAARVSITGVTDDVGTVTGNVAAGGTTDDSRPLIRGTGVAGDTIIVSTTDSTGTHEAGRATVAADGTWTLEPALPLLGGANSLRAVDMDAAGNQSGPSAPYAITLDFGKPAPPVIGNVQDNAGAMTGMLQKGDTTDDNTPTILGNAQPGSTVTLYDGTTLLGTTIADASGNFSFTPQMALADGAHGITATATNAAGQTSDATGVWGFQIDSAAPPVATEVVVTDDVGTSEGPIAPDSTTDDSRPEFSGKAEPGSTVEILDNGVRIGEVPVAEDGTWHFAPSEALADGTHALSVVVTDQAGNSSAPAPVLDITVDTRAVAVQITAVRDDVGGVTGSIAPDGMTDDKRPEIQGTGTVGATVTVLDGTTTLGTTTVDESGRWSFTPATDLADGAHAITATVTDASGTVSAPTPAFGFTLDTVAPDKGAIATVTDDVGPLQGPVDSGGATEDPQPTLAGVTEPGGRVDIYDNGQKIGTVTADAAGAWNFTPTTPLSEGTHSLETTVTDAAGNTSAKSDPYVIVTDYTPPDASRLAITGLTDDVGVVTGNVAAGATSDDASPVIRGTATAGDTIIVSTTDSTGTREIGRTTVAADGTWSLEPTLPLLSGNNALTAVEVDAAGNRTDPSAPYQVVLDFTRPPVPVLENVIDDVGRITGPLQKGDVTDDNRPTFTGTAEAGSTISIYDGSAAQVAGTLNALAVGDASRLLGTVTADASGRWSFTPTGPLADGPHTISVTATNPVGQTSDPTGLWDFRIDTGVPAMATDVVVTDDVGAVTGPITSGSTTDDSRPDFSGKAEPGSQVEILDNGVKLGEAVVGEDGTWHYAPAEALADGPHALTVVVVDPAGNVSAPTAALNTTVDTSDVVVQITAIHDDAGTVTGSIAPDASTDDVRPEIQGTGKAGSTITIFDGTTTLGTATVDGTGTWTFTPAADLTEGVHSITATARDLAGNVSAPTPALAFTVDTTAPVAAPIASLTDDVGPQQGPMSAGGVSDDAQPTLAGTVEANARVDVYNNGDRIGTVNADEAGNWTFTPPTPLPEGNHAFTITATDAAGNTSGMSPAFSIATDYTPPDASKLAINAVIDDVGTITGNVGPGTTTDDSSPVIRGTGTAGDTIIVSTTDSTGLREIGRTTVAADGTWSMEPTVPLLPGANSLSAVEMDPAGNQTGRSAPYAITLDFTRPTPPVIENVQDDVGSVVGMLQKGAVTDDARPAVIGTAQGGSTITVFDGATRLGTTTADASGNWTFTPATALADGAHNLTATATNAVGQTSEPTGVWNFRVDTAAPAMATEVVITDDVGAVTGPITAGSTTDDSRPDFSGTAEPGSKVEILDNGVKIGEVPVADDGTWRFSPPAALTDGDHSLVVVVTDPAGNSSAPTPAVNVTIDTSDVLVQISAVRDDVGAVTGNIAPNAATDDVRPEIQGTGKSGSTITVFDGGTQLGTTIVDGAGNWRFTPPTDLAQGAHSITATARDLAGNVSAPTAPFAFSIDTTVPSSAAADLAIRTVTDDVGAIQGPIANGGTTDDPQPTLSGIAEANSTVTVYDNDTRIGTARADEAGNWTFTPTTPLPEGNHAFTITATDAAGNTSAKSAPFALMTDFTAPDASRLAITGVVDDVGAVTGTVGPGATTDDASPLIQGTGTAGDTIILFTTDSTGRHEIGRATVATNGTWSMEPTLPLLPGANSLTAVEQDPAGNQTGQSAPYAISLDFTRPAPPVIENVQDDVGRVTGFLQKGDVTDDNRPAIIGTAQGGSRITIFDGSTQLGTTTADAGGNWSFTPATALTDGAHNMTATATNAVGQTSEPTGVWNFRVDTAVPAVATEVVMIDDVGAVTGPIAPGSTTDDSRPDFSGKAEPGSKVEILDNGVKIGEVTVGDDGTWSFSPPATLADGDHSMTVVVVDPAGNASAPTAPISFTTDTSSVVVQISALRDDVGSVTGNIAPNAATDDVRPEIQGTGKSGSTITVFDGTTQLGTTTVDGTGNWSFTPTADLSEGAHSITATARDLAGNVSAPTAPFAFSIDTTVPSSTPETLAIRAVTDDVGAIQGPIAAGGVTDDPQPTLSGIAEANSTVTVYDNDTRIGTARADEAGNWTFTPTTPLAEGNHAFTITATDAAGNTSARSAPFAFSTDFTAPDASRLAITGVVDDVGAVTGNVPVGATTDDASPVIRGTGTAGDTIVVGTTDSTGTHEIGRTTVAADGTWSLEPTLPLTGGSNVLIAVEVDPAGNRTVPSAPYAITLDFTRPAPPVIANVQDDIGTVTGFLQKGGVTDDSRPTIIGTAQGGSTVTVFDGATQLGTTTADGIGNWSFTPATALTDGTHNITATATNAVGQTSDPTGVWNFRIDTAAPAVATEIVMIDDVGAVTGPIAPGSTTDDSRPDFSGKAEPGSKVEIRDNGVKIGEVTVGDDGTWSFSPPATLADGDHSMTVVVVDPAGNASAPTAPISFTTDTSSVVVQISALRDDVGSVTGNIAPNAATDDVRPEIQGTGKSGSTITVFDGTTQLGTTTVDGAGNWSFTPTTDLSEGTHSITATARDLAGNVSAPTAPFAFSIDTTVPSSTPETLAIRAVTDDVGAIQGPIAAGGVTDDPQPTLSGIAEANSTVTVYDNDTRIGTARADEAGNWTFTPTTPLPEGNHAFTITATDAAGNTSARSAPFAFSTDFTVPDATRLAITGVVDDVGAVTGNVAAGAITDDGRPLIQGTGTAGDTIVVGTTDSTGTHEIGRTAVAADGTWSLEPTLPLIGGSNALFAVEVDPAGNRTSPSAAYVITLDFSKPAPPVIVNVQDDAGSVTGFLQKGGVTDDTRPTITGSAQGGSTVTIFDGETQLGTVTAEANGNWSFTPATLLADGGHSITATATNTVGQTSEPTGIWDFRIDTTAPAVATEVVITDDVGAVTGPIAPGSTTDDSRPDFSGKAEPGSKVEILDNGVKIGEVTVGDDGTWSFSPPATLPDGNHAITVVVTDPAGNSSAPSPAINFTTDTSSVVVQISAVRDDVGSVTGNVAPNGTTDDIRPEIQGTGKSGSTITVFDGTTQLGTTTVDGTGSWSFTPTADLSDGAHSITATARDLAGNVSAPTAAFAFTVDTVAPEPPSIGTISDDVGTVQGSVAPNGVTEDPLPTFAGAAEPGGTVTVYDNGSAIGTVVADTSGNWSFTPTTPLPEGAHAITATTTDAAGNTSAMSPPVAFTTDFTAPDAARLVITGVQDDVGVVTGNVASGATTDDASPVIQGTGTAGDTIIVSVVDGSGTRELGRATVAGDGTWSLAPTAPLNTGNNSITAVEVDPAGNATAPTAPYVIVLDTTVPAVPAIAGVSDDTGVFTGGLQKGGVTDDTTPTISGTAQAGSTIDVFDGATRLGSTTTDASGDWTFTPATALADGLHGITATATNPVGQTSAPTGIWAFTVDTAAPAPVAGLTAIDDVGARTGSLASGDITDDSRPGFGGQAEAGSTVRVFDNGTEIGSALVDPGGAWAWSPSTLLVDGNHAFTFVVRDAAGNSGTASAPFNLTVDTAAVLVQISTLVDTFGSVVGSIAPNGVSDHGAPEIQGTGKAGSTITIYDNGSAIGTAPVAADGTWTFTPAQSLAEGQHAITATATDLTGTVSEPTAPFTFTLDTTPPQTPDKPIITDDVGTRQATLADGAVTDDAQPTLSGTVEAGSTVDVYDNGVRIGAASADDAGNWSFTPATPLSEGQHQFEITATDAAGNTSAKSAPITVTTDYTPPDASRLAITSVTDDVGLVTGTLAAGATTDDTRPLVSGTGTAGNTIVLATTDGTPRHIIGRTTVREDGTWSLEPDLPLASGPNALTVVELDAAGNVSGPVSPFNIVVDVSTPPVPVIGGATDDVGPITGTMQRGGVTDDARPTFTGTGRAGDTIALREGATLLGTAQVASDGTWSFTPATPLSDGVHNIDATAVNPVGQASARSEAWQLSVDTTAPAAASNVTLTDDTGAVQGPVSSGATIDDSRPSFAGTAEAGSTVTLYDNGTAIGTARADDAGNWRFEPATALADGPHAFATVVTDPAGNSSAMTPLLSVTLDTADVVVQITAVQDDVGAVLGTVAAGGPTDDVRPTIQGTGQSGSTITVFDGATTLGTTTVDATGAWSFTPAADLAEGAHSITVTATNLAGNTSAPTPPFALVVDTTAPTGAAITTLTENTGATPGPVPNGGVTGDARPQFEGKAEANGRVDILDNGTTIGTVTADENGNWRFTPGTALPEGSHAFTITVTDAAGNTSVPSAPMTVTTDYTPPDAAGLRITGLVDDVGAVTGNVAAGVTTDDASPVIQGTGTAGDTIIVSTADSTGTHEIGRTTVGTDGTWSLEPAQPLLPGEHTLTAVEVDPAGNATAPSAPYAIVVDFSKPSVPTLANVLDDVGIVTGTLQKGDVTDDTRPTFTGTAQANSTITIYDGPETPVPLGTATADENGNWSFTPATALADGAHNITITATNPVGQTSAPTGIWDFRVDTAAPAMATNVVVTDAVGARTGPLAANDTTDDNRPTFSGNAEAGSTVAVFDNGEKIGEAKADASGAWTLQPATALADGGHALSVVVTDPAGNSSAATPALDVKVDTSAVLVQITALRDDAGTVTANIAPAGVTDDTLPTIDGTGKAGSTITVRDTTAAGTTTLGTALVDGTGHWTFTPATALAEGAHSISATATDLAGNVSDPTPAFAFSVDTTAPTSASVGELADDVGERQGTVAPDGLTDDSQPTISGTAEAGSRVDVYDNGDKIGTVTADASGTWSFTPPTPLPEGAHAITITATDVAGNTSAMSPAFSVTTDYTAPDASRLAITGMTDDVGVITGEVARDATIDDASPVIRGTGTAGDTIIVSTTDETGKREIGRATVGADGNWSMEPALPLVSGANAITAVEMDPAGNQTAPTSSYDIIVDFSRPPAPTIENVQDDVGIRTGLLQKGAVTDDAMPTITGTAQAGSRIILYDGATQIGGGGPGASIVADENGNWSYTLGSLLQDGEHTITASAINPVGQTSDLTGVWNFFVDTTAPDAAAGVVAIDDVGARTGTITEGQTTDDSRPVLAGKAEPGSMVAIRDHGVRIGVATVDAQGNWSFQPTQALADGDHALTVIVVDPAGNPSAATPALNFKVDTTAVLVQIAEVRDDVGAIQDTIQPGGVTDDTRPEIRGTGKAASTITVFDGLTAIGTATVDGTGHWTFTPATALAQGTHTITATATDLAGNVSAPTSAFTFTVDTTPPAAPVIAGLTDDVGSTQGEIAAGGVTEDSQPTIHGTAEAGSTVDVYDNGDRIGTVTANASGVWSFTPTSPLAEGAHAFTATATDAAGNTGPSSAPRNVTTDYTPPDVSKLTITAVTDDIGVVTGNVARNGITDDTNPVIQGAGTAGNTIILSTTDGTGLREIGRATVAGDGTWSITPAAPLLAGENKLTAVEMDAAGNQTVPSAPYVITLDLARPVPPVIAGMTDDVGSVTGPIARGGATDDRQPFIHGTAIAASMVVLYDGTEVLGIATVQADGTWSLAVARDLAEGDHDITATAINTVGQTSDPTEAWRITVDTTAPDVSRLAVTGVGDDAGAVTGNVPNGGSTDDTRPLIQGTGTAGDTIIVSTTDFSGTVELGRTTVASDGNWSFTPTADLAAGSNAFSAVEVDPAGNASTRSANYTITVVTVKPPVAITEILDDVGDVTGALKPGSATDDGRPTINGVTEAGSTVSVFDGATLLGTAVANASGDWTFTPLAALAEGLHNLTARAVNPLGQSSDPTPGWGINVDVTPPVSASTTLDLMDASDWGVSNKDNITGDATPDLEGKVVASAETLDKLTVTLFVDVNGDNQAGPGDMFLARSIPVQADGSWSTSLASLKTGTYALRAVLVDEAGNQQVASAGSLIGPTGTPNSPLVIEAGGRMTYIGAKAGDQAGWEMADAGDFNGDGIGDFIVTAPYVDGNRADTGAAYILFGGAGGLPPIVHLGQLKASQGLRIKGHAFVKDNQTNDLMGLVLNKFGDFNRDGYADVFLASHYNDKAYVVFGAPNGSYADGVLDLSTIDGGDLGTSPIDNSHGFLISELPLSEDSGMGYSIGGSDINGDGYLDLMISNISGNKAAGSTGHALVIYGGANMNDSTTGWKNITLSQTNKDTIFRVQQDVKNTSITGGDASNVAGNRVKNANIGDNITSIGDVNGDGIADMLIIDSTSGGKTQINPLTSGGGTAYVVYGKTGGLPATMDLRNFKNGVDGVRLHTMLDDTLGTDNFASHVMTSALGDINGDGVDDFAMGSPVNLGRVWVIYGKAGGYAARDIYLDVGAPNDGKNYFARDPGHVKSFTSADGFVILNKASTVAAPARSTEQFGYAVKADGDINADGIPDFVIGAPNTKNPAGLQTGAIYVVYGTGQNISQPVLAINDIIADPAKGIVIYGDKSGEKLGSSVAVGDWNGDGLVDIAAGSSGSDVSGRDAAGQNYGGTDSGAAYIYYSRADFTQPYTNGNDILTGTLNGGADGFDRLFGGSGSDTFLSVSTGDYANGGAGNDTIHVSALDFKAVDGGMGTDVLVFDGKNQNIDLNLFKSKITGIEKIDLGINGSNLMTIGYNDVQRLGAMNLASNDGKAQFIVTGDNTDTLALRKPTGYNWTDAGHQTLDGVSYHVYTLGTSELFVDDRVNVTLL